MSDEPLPKSEIILSQTEDGRTRIQCRFETKNEKRKGAKRRKGQAFFACKLACGQES